MIGGLSVASDSTLPNTPVSPELFELTANQKIGTNTYEKGIWLYVQTTWFPLSNQRIIPDPTPVTTYPVKYGIAKSASGNIISTETLNAVIGRTHRITKPSNVLNDYFVIEVPTGRVLSFVSEEFAQNINLISEFFEATITGGKRYSLGPLNEGLSQPYNITIS